MRKQIVFDSKRFSDDVRAGRTADILRSLARKGIVFDTGYTPKFLLPETVHDVQSELVTVGSAGIPAFLATYVNPKVIRVLMTPIKIAEIVGEVQNGDWLSEVTMFLTAEATGEPASYGDYSNAGQSNVNVNFPQRQNYIFQAFMQYGQRELAMAGLAKLDWASEQQAANALTMMKYLNQIYAFGVTGLQNYGLLNDPNLSASITPTYSWLSSSSATANTIYQDFVRLFELLQTQAGGLVTMEDSLVLALSPRNAVALKNITQYNTNSVEVLLRQNFPNLRIETAVQYSSASGELVQLIADNHENQKTAECAYSSKLMAHMLIPDSSSWKQKRSSGAWGTVITRPFLIASMLG